MLWPFTNRTREIDTLVSELQSLELRLEESTTAGTLALISDDIGWNLLSGLGGQAVTEQDRISYLQMARVLSVRDALCRQATELWTNFGIGAGAGVSAPDGSTERRLSAFWNDAANRVVFSAQGQREVAGSLFRDGDIFFLYFPGNPGRVRQIDTLEITKVITDPDDAYSEAAIVREYTDSENKRKKLTYAIWDYEPQPGAESAVPGDATPGVWAFHYRLTGTKGRGCTGLIAAIEWARAHRQFMKARHAIQQEMAKIARKLKVKGGPAQVNAARSREQARAAARSETRSTTPATATTYIENEGQDLQPTAQETGAQAALIDGNMTIQIFGASVGIYPHYFGAGEAFRLATATAMEVPMLVTFQAFQANLKQIFSDLCGAELDEAGLSADDVTITMPDVFPANRQTMLASVNATLIAFPQFAESAEVQKFVLELLSVPNPQEVIDGFSKEPVTQEGKMVREFVRTLVKVRESKEREACKC